MLIDLNVTFLVEEAYLGCYQPYMMKILCKNKFSQKVPSKILYKFKNVPLHCVY